MNEVPTVAEHLKKLAKNYHSTHFTLQTASQEMTSSEDFLVELKQREAALIKRFRLVQKQLLAALKEEELERILELSRVFDEIRIVSQFAMQTLTASSKAAEVKGREE